MYYFLRRKFIPPFHETFNDIIIIVIENYSSDKGNFYFSNETVETVDNLIKSLAPMDVKVGNSITRKMIEKKIETFLVDGKALKFYKSEDFESKYSMLPSPLKNGKPFDLENITKLSNDFRIKLKTYYKDYSSIHDFSVDFDPEIEDILRELGIHMRLEDYEKDLKYRSYKEIIDYPLKTYDKLFARKDAQDQILFESKVSFFLSQILVERVFGNDILKDVLDLAVKKTEFLNHIREVLNFLVNFRMMDYDHQIKKDVEIPYIIEHKNDVKELFFNEKFLSLLISRNLLKDLQNVTSQVTYFKFLTFILQNKFSLKIFISICDYLELLKNEAPQIKAAGDIISNESESIPTIIKNTSVILTAILNIFYSYKENPIITTIATKCLQNLLLLDYENAKYFDQNDFYSILGEHLLSSDQSVVFNAIYLLVLLTSKKYDQTKVIGGNKSLLYRLLNIFRGIKVANHSFHPEVILLLLKYFSRLIRNNTIKEILESDNNRKFIKYILRYLYNYESSFDVDDDCNLYYFDIHSALFKFLYNYVDQDAESKKYLENNFKIISLINKKFAEFNYIIDQILNNNMKKENLLLTSLLENTLNFLREYTGNDKNRSNEYQNNANNVILFIRKSQAYGTMLKNICKEKKIDEKKEIKNINKRCQELERCYKGSD